MKLDEPRNRHMRGVSSGDAMTRNRPMRGSGIAQRGGAFKKSDEPGSGSLIPPLCVGRVFCTRSDSETATDGFGNYSVGF